MGAGSKSEITAQAISMPIPTGFTITAKSMSLTIKFEKRNLLQPSLHASEQNRHKER
jgi:hypothetical protein